MSTHPTMADVIYGQCESPQEPQDRGLPQDVKAATDHAAEAILDAMRSVMAFATYEPLANVDRNCHELNKIREAFISERETPSCHGCAIRRLAALCHIAGTNFDQLFTVRLINAAHRAGAHE